MNARNDTIPMIIASVVALAITLAVRWFMPAGNGSGTAQQTSGGDLSMPEIPLMVKKTEKKIIEHQVLIAARNIKKNEKISANCGTWKQWPADAVQPYFIVKDTKGTPLNNVADYNNAMRMWAKSDIPPGVPLIIQMLTPIDPIKKTAEEKKQAEEAKKKQAQLIRKRPLIQMGMRAVTFNIDQKTASSTNILAPGDYVDVLIIEQKGAQSKTHKYKALKIVAIDGETRNHNENLSTAGNIMNNIGATVGHLVTPKNVTLEVKERMVEKMLQQASSNGITLSIRSQAEKPIPEEDDEEDDSDIEEDEEDSGHTRNVHLSSNSILGDIMRMNMSNNSSAEPKEEEEKSKESKEKDALFLINSMNLANNGIASSQPKDEESDPDMDETETYDGKLKELAKYEVVRGKITGEEPNEDKQSAVIYRKLTPNVIQFDENGKITDGTQKERPNTAENRIPKEVKKSASDMVRQ
ncbi:MAG: SAF domain-containing protein [Holosporaceae bacterium]|jgi:Flp pilus assembly protein CpaB|nr:SAF domain-containing protein [Holosporaceae bacterium]